MANRRLSKVLGYLHQVAPAPDEGAATDGRLLEQFVTLRAEEAFAALVRRHGAMVRGVCLRVLDDPHDADDAFQATFLVLARKADSIRRRASVGSWLYGVAYRTARRARAAAARRRAHERQVEAMPLAGPVADAAWRDLRPLLDAELDRLPEKYRAPLVLCYLEGKTYEQAGRQLGWSTGTVSGRLARARDLLRRRLVRRGVALSGGLLAALLSERAASACPSSLTLATIKAATLSAAGPAAAAGAVSAPVAALVEGVLQTMVVTKMKLATFLLVTLSLVTTGAGVVAYGLAAGPEGGQAARAAPEPRAQDKEKPKQDADPARLREENERLRRELEQARKELIQVKKLAEQLRQEAEAQRDRAEAARREAVQQERRARAAAEDALRQAERARAEADRARVEAQRAAQEERAARERAKEDGARAVSVNNLKQLALAVHNYHDVHGHLPPAAVYGKDGKALLSWRVLLLPYLEQEDLYKQFKLDEAWDSPHNKKLIAKMPAVFAATDAARKTHATVYQAFTGKNTLFDGAKGVTFKQVTDGLSQTLLFVEAGKGVAWSKPEDLLYEPGKALPKLGGLWQGGFYAALADGSVHFIGSNFNADVFRHLITRNDGQEVDFNKLSK